ncbi:hypothetical protein Tco_0335151 [Tanacetum coccineum]
MLAICSPKKPVVFKGPKPSSIAERIPQGTKPGAKLRHKKHSTSLKQPFVSSKEATKKVGPLKHLPVPKLAILRKEKSLARPWTQTQASLYEGLEIVLTQPTIGKRASSIAKQVEEDESPRIINDEDEEADEVHATTNSQKHKLELKNNKAEAEVALLKAQPSFPNVLQLNKLLVKSLQIEFSKILSAPDFSSSLPTKLKDLPSKLTEEIKGLKKQVHELEIELPGDLKEIPSKTEDFTKTVTSLTSQVVKLKILQCELPAEFISVPSQVEIVQAKLKSLDALPSLLNKVTNALNQFAQTIASKKTGDTSVPSTGQDGTQPAEEEKNTNQATISQLFQRKAAKNANLIKQQSKPTPPPTTPIIPPIITTTTQMQTPLQSLPKTSSQPEGEHIKKDKGKKAMSSEEVEKESTISNSDDETDNIHLTKEQINQQKKIEEEAKAEAAKQEGEVRKAELVDLLDAKVVNKYYDDKLQYDRYYDKMLNRRTESRITNYDVLNKKGPITLKVYREDGTSEVIRNFKSSDLHLGEWREVVKACPNRTGKGWKTIYGQIQTRMDYLHTTEVELGINLDIPLINKRLKLSVQYEDHLPGTVLNEPVLGMIMFNSYHRQDFVTIKDLKDFSNTMLYTVQEIFFKRHQGLGQDDHARTFNSLLLAEVDKRNLNPLKHMRVIEQLRQ